MSLRFHLRRSQIALLIIIAALVSAVSVRVSSVFAQDPAPVNLTLVGYAVPREAYAEIIPLFQAYWLEQTGQTVTFEESYAGSGSQSRAVIGGLEADIVALSHEDHVTRIADAGLITSDWQAGETRGFVTDSVAVLAVRPGNPKEIQGWADLAREGVEVVTPDPATSGAAQWNILAAYGAAFRGHVDGYDAGEEGAAAYLADVLRNVVVFDADGRASFLTFEDGVGDVAITYENEAIAAYQAGGEFDVVYPTSTILIENPIAVVDVYADAHGVREVADAFVQFTYTPEAQAIFASKGFRPVIDGVLEDNPDLAVQFPEIEDLFTINDFGGWPEVVPTFFGDDGIYTQIITTIQGQ
ncbi:MAG: sulfate ABC transporter substrate-binding protein [Anaerolineae bacterium]